MSFIRKSFVKLGNKGLSMVELICAVAIVTLLGTVLSSIFIVGANSYRGSGSETEVQKEAQLVANQITDYVIDSAKDVKIISGVLKITLSDHSEASISLSGTDLMYSDPSGSYLMAEGVQSFVPSMTDGNVQVKMTLKSGDRAYDSVFNVAPRNLETSDSSISQKVKLTSLIKRWVLEPNEEFDFDGKITPSSGGYTLSIENDKSSAYSTRCTSDDTVLSGNVLKVGKDETVSCIRVVAKSIADPTVKTYINVYVRRVNAINVAGELKSGTALKAGAVYQLKSTFSGSSLSKVSGAAYDDPTGYYNTRAVKYVVDNSGASSKAEIINGSGNTKCVKLLQDLDPGDVITIKAIPLHTRGTEGGVQRNRTGLEYSDIFGIYMISSTLNPLIPNDEGWKRLSDAAQATVNDFTAFTEVLKNIGIVPLNAQLAHRYKVQYKEVGAAEFIKVDNPALYGADGMGSSVINIRPLISGSMDYLKDYVVQITWEVYDKNDENNVYYSYTLEQNINHVSVKFSSQFVDGGALLDKWSEARAVDLTSMKKGDKLLVLDKPSVTGISLIQKNGAEADRISNELKFVLDKKEGGSYKPLTDKSYLENKQGVCEYNQDSSLPAGEYRIRVIANLPKITVDSTGKITEGSKSEYNLYQNSPSGSEEGIFYFRITQPPVYFSSTVLGITNVKGVSEAEADFAKISGNFQIGWSVNKNNVNLNAKIQKKNADNSWSDVSGIGYEAQSTGCLIRMNNTNLGEGTYRILLSSGDVFQYDLNSGDGVIYFKVDKMRLRFDFGWSGASFSSVTGITRDNAPKITPTVNTQVYDAVKCLQGDLDQNFFNNTIGNSVKYELYRVNGDDFVAASNISVQNNQFGCSITVGNNYVKGLYAIKVSVIKNGEVLYQYDESTGEGIFYFELQ